MSIKLYNFAFGPYPQRLNIYLAEKNPATVELVIFDAPNRQAGIPPAEVSTLTPTGSLPLLVDADGTIVGQSLAILEYLEDKVAGPEMRGDTPAARARTRQIVHMFDEAMTFFGLWARHGSILGRDRIRISQDIAEICASRYFDQLRLIEQMMKGEDFIAGSDVTTADCVAMATLQYASDFYAVPLPPGCPRLRGWFDRFSQRASAVRPTYPEQIRAKALGLMDQTGIGF